MRVSAHPILRVMLVLLALTTISPLVQAQPGRRPGDPFGPNQPGQPGRPGQPGQPGGGEAACGAAACGAYAVFMIVILAISVAAMVAWIFVAIWASKDAKSRGMDNSGMWVVLILFTGMIGLIIYLVSRPQGDLKTCRECGNKRLRESYRCPHCRAA
jgi:di/tricarboxylate transporter